MKLLELSSEQATHRISTIVGQTLVIKIMSGTFADSYMVTETSDQFLKYEQVVISHDDEALEEL